MSRLRPRLPSTIIPAPICSASQSIASTVLPSTGFYFRHGCAEFLHRGRLLVQDLVPAHLELSLYIAVGVRYRSVVPGV